MHVCWPWSLMTYSISVCDAADDEADQVSAMGCQACTGLSLLCSTLPPHLPLTHSLKSFTRSADSWHTDTVRWGDAFGFWTWLCGSSCVIKFFGEWFSWERWSGYKKISFRCSHSLSGSIRREEESAACQTAWILTWKHFASCFFIQRDSISKHKGIFIKHFVSTTAPC